MPPIPPWNAIHPQIVHFPIALLITAPLFVLLALILPSRRSAFATSALILMLLGTIGAVVAVESGEAGEDNAKRIPEAVSTFHEHAELGERTRNVFIALTVVFGAVVLAGTKLSRHAVPMVYVAFLAMYLGGLTILVNTAHRGGLLVHHFGARAPIPGAPAPALATPPDAEKPDGDGD
ncbi:MAG: DUF2231 domain-containing protein [bacterium]